MMDEAELIRLAASGDREAFSALMERYEQRVYHQALRLVGHPEDAADVTQEVFFKAWRGLPRFQGDSAFSTWLYKLTDNAAIDLLRRPIPHAPAGAGGKGVAAGGGGRTGPPL